MKIGVLAAQGAFIEHINVLCRLGVETMPIRLPREFAGLDGLIIPGGESTTITRLMLEYDLADAIKHRVEKGMAVFGTCAGLILLASVILDGNEVKPLELMDIKVRRNAFGRQVDSFETDLAIPALGKKPFHAVFIRAPVIEQVNGKVEVLARLDDGTPVACRQGKFLATAFHPELTDDLRFHKYFMSIISEK